LGGYNIECFNIPSVDQYLHHYVNQCVVTAADNNDDNDNYGDYDNDDDVALGGYNIECFNIPSVDQYLQHYVQLTSMKPIDNWNFYMAYVLFRSAAILQDVYKRFTLGLYQTLS